MDALVKIICHQQLFPSWGNIASNNIAKKRIIIILSNFLLVTSWVNNFPFFSMSALSTSEENLLMSNGFSINDMQDGMVRPDALEGNLSSYVGITFIFTYKLFVFVSLGQYK